jgi:D-threo-aldose 1-dehydrogenase
MEDVQALNASVPDGFWQAMRDQGFIAAQAPLPFKD